MHRHYLKSYLAVLCLFILTGCATTGEDYTGPRAVAVWDLEDLSPRAGGRPDLWQLLSGEIIQALQQADVQVVERQKILAILEELNLGSSSLADEGTRLRVGRMTGARLPRAGGDRCWGMRAAPMRLV